MVHEGKGIHICKGGTRLTIIIGSIRKTKGRREVQDLVKTEAVANFSRLWIGDGNWSLAVVAGEASATVVLGGNGIVAFITVRKPP